MEKIYAIFYWILSTLRIGEQKKNTLLKKGTKIIVSDFPGFKYNGERHKNGGKNQLNAPWTILVGTLEADLYETYDEQHPHVAGQKGGRITLTKVQRNTGHNSPHVYVGEYGVNKKIFLRASPVPPGILKRDDWRNEVLRMLHL